MSCIPNNSKKHLSSTEMMNERKLWRPLDDYGDDSVYCISPPTVPEESKLVYDQCVSKCKQGAFSVPEEDRQMYDLFNDYYPKEDKR